MPKDKKNPPTGVPGAPTPAGAPLAPCYTLNFEVEFLHCVTEADVAASVGKLNAIPSDKFIKDHDPTLILSGEARHYVNLTQKDTWIDGTMTHVDRTTQNPRIVVRFKERKSRQVKVEIFDPTGSNLQYSKGDAAKEEERNPDHFKPVLEREGVTDGNGVLIITDFNITACGGNKYQVKATDKATKEVQYSSGTLETWRYFWVQPIQYTHLTNPIPMGAYATSFEHAFIALNTTEYPMASDEGLEVLDDNDKPPYWNAVRGRYNRAKEPYTVPLLFPRANLGDTATNTYQSPMAGADNILRAEICPPLYDPNKFVTRDWITSAEFEYTDTHGAKTTANIINACEVVTSNNSSFSSTVTIDRSKFPAAIRGAIAGDIDIEFSSVVDEWYLGDQSNNACTIVAEKPCGFGAPGAPFSSLPGAGGDGIPSTIVHEMGHYMNMVPDGSGQSPDDLGNHTRDRAHGIGPHCLPAGSVAGPTGDHCVMYGTAMPGTPETFCANCITQLRKMNLSTGKRLL